MNSYTISIAPNDDSGSTTTLVVDMSGGAVRITDVHLHASGGLSGGQMPTVDFAMLLRAISPVTMRAPIDATSAPAAIQAEPVRQIELEPSAPRPRRRAKQAVAAAETAEPAVRSRTRRSKTAASTKTAAATKTATPAKSATPAKATKSASRKKAAKGGVREYRRMPEDFATVYERSGSAAAVAEHYAVPRYTAHSWIRRIRTTASA